jgi:hypothetical protein
MGITYTSTIEEISVEGDMVFLREGGNVMKLPVSGFADKAYLRKAKKGDEIFCSVKNSFVNKIYFLAYKKPEESKS